MKNNRRGSRALRTRNVHLHYGTGSLHILKEDFVDLAVELPTPWSGQYVLEVIYFVEEKSGGSGEEKFDRNRHISSLSFMQRSGLKWASKR